MQLLDDDMDELFRNAASRYPLKTSGADWDAFSRRLHPENEAVPPPPADTPPPPHRTNWWRGLGLLALLLVAVGIYWVTTQVAPSKQNNNIAKNIVVTNTDTPGNTATLTSLTVDSNEPGNSVPQDSVAGSQANMHNPGSTPVAQVAPENKVVPPAVNTAVADGTAARKVATVNKSVAKENIPPAENTSKSRVSSTHDRTTYNPPDIQPVDKTNTTTPATVTAMPVTDAPAYTKASAVTDSASGTTAPLEVNAVSGKTLSFHPASDKISGITAPLPVQPFKGTGSKAFAKGFYAGIVMAPDLSTVKMQHTSVVGYSFGAVVGYRISRHWAVETGASWEKKNYYSKGEYFNKSKLKNPDLNIITLDGFCRMVDVPVNVRYYFNTTPKQSWYANVGISSYFMSREWYKYHVEDNGAYYDRMTGYNTATQNWFSVLGLGLGYEHKVGGIGNVRIEPYVKVPLGAGIGIGSLPVTSLGINIGITRNIRW